MRIRNQSLILQEDPHLLVLIHFYHQEAYCHPFINLLLFPGNIPTLPRASSILNNWLYLAILSNREADPVLICPVFSATARSAIFVSSVSPLRWLIIVVNELFFASSTELMVSLRLPIWFTLIRMELPDFSSIPRCNLFTLVTNKSSPTI